MGIQALPNSTVRALGASQALNDPVSVIKELLDNALDARATSIAIEISSNTVDSIQVRDNGHGIPSEDRNSVARPHCTSKISGEDDLKTIGGTSLGFRGEALASVAEMSDSLTISTRVEGEEVAVALKINQQGEVVGQERASLPVGTTVKISGFVKGYPVRNQNALRNSEKCLKRIKQMLQSYAFARPHVRFSFRVLKVKNHKTNWTYAPKADGNAEDAAFKIVGVPCASQCAWSIGKDQGFTLQAFLPKLDADVSKVSGIGAFLSVDARPVSAAQGISKQLVKIYRDTLKKPRANFDGVNDPFIHLEIACPPSSYDVNVELAKDDVLFENPNIVLEAARRLFDAAYPSQEPAKPLKDNLTPNPKGLRRRRPLVGEDDFATSVELPFGERSNLRPSGHVASSIIPEEAIQEIMGNSKDRQRDIAEPSTRHTFRSNMYGCDEEHLDLLHARPPTGRTEEDFEEFRLARSDVNVSNPWVMAKMHSVSHRRGEIEEHRNAQHGGNILPTSSLESEFKDGVRPANFDSHSLPTPRPSSPSSSSQNFHPPGHVPQVSLGEDGRMIGSYSRPPPLKVTAPPSSFNNENEYSGLGAQSSLQLPAYDSMASSQAAEPTVGTLLHAIPDASTRSRRNPPRKLHQTLTNKPARSPLKDQPLREKVWFDHLERHSHGRQQPAISMIESRNNPQPKRGRSAGFAKRLPLDQNAENSNSPTLPNVSDFVSAAELAVPEAHQGASKDACRVAKRRKTSEARAMREISGDARTNNDDDEEFRPNTRGRTVSRRRRMTDIWRTKKSAQLPLERVPAGMSTQHIVLHLSTTNRKVLRLASKVKPGQSQLDRSGPARDAGNALTSFLGPVEMQDLTAKLYDALVSRVSDGEMVQDLGMLVQTALTAHKVEIMNADV